MEKILLTPRDDIFVVKEFCSDEYCEALVARAEAAGFGEAPINVFGGGTIVNKKMRDNERVIIDDYDLAKELWPKVEPLVANLATQFSEPVALNERFRFYRYQESQKFDWHFDASYVRNAHEASLLTFMLYLSDGFTGGTTDFHMKVGAMKDDDPLVTVVPEKGMALVFTHNVLHRGAPVTAGCKYVLRSDVMFRRKD